MRQIIRSRFEFDSISDVAWGLQARRLKRAADYLLARVREGSDRIVREEAVAIDLSDWLDLIAPASLLYGLALENVLKAIIIQRKKPSVAEMRLLFGGGSGHSLSDLALRAEFDLSGDERDLVNRLSAYVEWAGRYPVAKKVEKMALRQKAVEGEWSPLPLQLHESGLFDTLFTRGDAVIFS